MPTQLRESRERIAEHGYIPVGEYVDAERYRDGRNRMVEPSAFRTDRPAFCRMMDDGRAGKFDVVVAWKEDGLCRGLKAGAMVHDVIVETNIKIDLVRETFDIRMLGIKAAMSGIERENIRERIIMGQVGRLEKGLLHGGRTPHGYVAVRGSNGRAQAYEFYPEWREFCDELAFLFLRGLPFHEMGYRLGINPDTGRTYHGSTIYDIRTNLFYRGYVTNGKMRAKGKHQAAWDAGTIKAIEKERARRAAAGHNGPRRRKRPGLLSGIVRCGICGRALAGVSGARTAYGLRAGGYLCTLPDYGRQRYDPSLIHDRIYINEKKLLMNQWIEQVLASDYDGPAGDVFMTLDKLRSLLGTLSPAIAARSCRSRIRYGGYGF